MTKKELEYPDSPSGYVTLYNYKEPFMRFEEGYGYTGVLLFDGKTEKVQCHFCGEWLNYLPHHLHREHNMTAKAYKDKVGLYQSSALLSEKARENLLLAGLDKRKENLIPGKKKTNEQKEKIRKTLKDNWSRMEQKNKLGTCPLQLIDRLKKLSEKLGRCPTTKEITFAETLKKVFGTVRNAMKKAGLKPLKPGQNLNHFKHKISDKELIDQIHTFREIYKRDPSYSDFKRGLLSNYKTFARRFGSMDKIKML